MCTRDGKLINFIERLNFERQCHFQNRFGLQASYSDTILFTRENVGVHFTSSVINKNQN